MTSPASLQIDRTAFMATIAASGLLTPAQLDRATASLPPQATTPAQIAQALVSGGFLTRFQAERLLAGRPEGFHLGQYVIQDQVGRGSVGRVYRAKHKTMNRAVAIKVLHPSRTATPAAREAIQREVRAAAKLTHPNIVTAYDANAVGERFYLVLEFVDGPTLDSLVHTRGRLSVADACEFVSQTAIGLAHAQNHGMAHGDVKPANLLVARPPKGTPGWVIKITDFGIPASATDGSSPGSPDYAAPERTADPASADPRADLYSLGAVFYLLLTGRPPFPGGTAEEKARRHRTEEPARVETLRPDVPPAVAGIVHKLLAKDPAARLASAAELAERLDALTATPDTAGAVSFELPSPHTGPYTFESGYLTGMHPPDEPLVEASPWSSITDDTGVTGTLSPDMGITPLTTKGLPPPAPPGTWAKPPATPGGLSVWTMVTLAAGVVSLCLIGIAFLLRNAGK